MGHGNIKKVGQVLLNQLYAKGQVTIKELVEYCIKKNTPVEASEGDYNDESMVSWGIETQIIHLLQYKSCDCENQYKCLHEVTPVIEPFSLTKKDFNILNEYVQEGFEWDFEDKRFQTILNMKWKFARGWRKKFKEIVLISSIEN